MLYRQNILLGALLILVSELMFASMGAVVKHASQTVSNEMLVFMRNLMGMLVMLPILLHHRAGSLKTAVPHLHLLRAIFGVSAMYCFFYALAHMPLADGVLMKMTTPMFMPLVAWFWLREASTPWAMVAIPVGFVGVALVLDPSGETSWVAMIGVLGGLFASFAKVTVRRLGHTEPMLRTVFYFSVLGALVSLLPMLMVWKFPTYDEWWLLLAIGLFGSLGQLLLTRGYAVASTSTVGPFSYFSVVFASIYGYLFWAETLDWMFLAGAGLIAVAGMMAVRKQKPVSLPGLNAG